MKYGQPTSKAFVKSRMTKNDILPNRSLKTDNFE